jgi:tetratricopeptide (TPR) repeat protein
MSDTLPPVMTEPPMAGRLPRLAAIYSLLAPFIVFFIYLFLFWYMEAHGRTRLVTLGIIGSLPLLLILLGIALGIVALAMIKRQEHKGIFGVALAGVCINSLLIVLLFVGPYFFAMAFRKNHPMTLEGRLDKAKQKLAVAAAGEDRFCALDDVAKESFVAGRIEDARKYATELLTLAPDYESNWNYGNAIQDGNLVLGRIAVREGRLEEAKQYLLAAGKSKGSPQMDSFGPNMSLAKDLLEKGERDSVLQYFELCRKFWTMDYGKLDDWRQEVKAGKIPKFGANLVY